LGSYWAHQDLPREGTRPTASSSPAGVTAGRLPSRGVDLLEMRIAVIGLNDNVTKQNMWSDQPEKVKRSMNPEANFPNKPQNSGSGPGRARDPAADSGIPAAGQPALSMSSLGNFGRFGNQLLQYAFLKICAQKSGARAECPPWPGQKLFGLSDPPVATRLPPAVECWEAEDNLFDVIPELIPFIEKQAGAKSCRVGPAALEHGLANVDLWGHFQVHTRFLRPHQDYFRSLFQPVPELKHILEKGWNRLQAKGRTVIGIHLRQGDLINNPLFGFAYVVPPSWWCDWLDTVWERFDQPVLFLCSDDLEQVLPAFKKYSPITSRELEIQLPESMKGLDFYVDFYLLTQCHVVGTANSTFSTVACLLNQRASLFVRPHWDFSTKFTRFDPWNCEHLLYFGQTRRKLFKSFCEALYVARATRGVLGWLACLVEYPAALLKIKLAGVKLGHQLGGLPGATRSLLGLRPGKGVQRCDDLRD
jgi:hypothetical protein